MDERRRNLFCSRDGEHSSNALPLLRYRLDTGAGESNTGTFEEGMVAKESDRKGVSGGDAEESPMLLSGDDGFRW